MSRTLITVRETRIFSDMKGRGLVQVAGEGIDSGVSLRIGRPVKKILDGRNRVVVPVFIGENEYYALCSDIGLDPQIELDLWSVTPRRSAVAL